MSNSYNFPNDPQSSGPTAPPTELDNISIKNLSYSLCRHLSDNLDSPIPVGKHWKHLAETLGPYNHVHINKFEQQAYKTQKSETQLLLEDYGTHENSTIGNLVRGLYAIDRRPLAQDIIEGFRKIRASESHYYNYNHPSYQPFIPQQTAHRQPNSNTPTDLTASYDQPVSTNYQTHPSMYDRSYPSIHPSMRPDQQFNIPLNIPVHNQSHFPLSSRQNQYTHAPTQIYPSSHEYLSPVSNVRPELNLSTQLVSPQVTVPNADYSRSPYAPVMGQNLLQETNLYSQLNRYPYIENINHSIAPREKFHGRDPVEYERYLNYCRASSLSGNITNQNNVTSNIQNNLPLNIPISERNDLDIICNEFERHSIKNSNPGNEAYYIAHQRKILSDLQNRDKTKNNFDANLNNDTSTFSSNQNYNKAALFCEIPTKYMTDMATCTSSVNQRDLPHATDAKAWTHEKHMRLDDVLMRQRNEQYIQHEMVNREPLNYFTKARHDNQATSVFQDFCISNEDNNIYPQSESIVNTADCISQSHSDNVNEHFVNGRFNSEETVPKQFIVQIPFTSASSHLSEYPKTGKLSDLRVEGMPQRPEELRYNVASEYSSTNTNVRGIYDCNNHGHVNNKEFFHETPTIKQNSSAFVANSAASKTTAGVSPISFKETLVLSVAQVEPSSTFLIQTVPNAVNLAEGKLDSTLNMYPSMTDRSQNSMTTPSMEDSVLLSPMSSTKLEQPTQESIQKVRSMENLHWRASNLDFGRGAEAVKMVTFGDFGRNQEDMEMLDEGVVESVIGFENDKYENYPGHFDLDPETRSSNRKIKSDYQYFGGAYGVDVAQTVDKGDSKRKQIEVIKQNEHSSYEQRRKKRKSKSKRDKMVDRKAQNVLESDDEIHTRLSKTNFDDVGKGDNLFTHLVPKGQCLLLHRQYNVTSFGNAIGDQVRAAKFSNQVSEKSRQYANSSIAPHFDRSNNNEGACLSFKQEIAQNIIQQEIAQIQHTLFNPVGVPRQRHKSISTDKAQGDNHFEMYRRERSGSDSLSPTSGSIGSVNRSRDVEQKLSMSDKTLKVQQFSKGKRNIRVFLTYARDSFKHIQRVVSLFKCLTANGFSCSMDMQDVPVLLPKQLGTEENGRLVSPTEQWFKKRYKFADFIIVCVSKKYAERIETATSDFDSLSSDELHTKYIYTCMYNEFLECGQRNIRFIPLLFGDASESDIPEWLRKKTSKIYSWPCHYKDMFWLMIRMMKKREEAKAATNGVTQSI